MEPTIETNNAQLDCPIKIYISPDSLREDSFLLGCKVIKSGFKPDVAVALYRGGTPVSLPMSELFKYVGIQTDCISIRTKRYTGIDKVSSEVQVFNLGYLSRILNKNTKLLFIDDVLDTGVSIEAVFNSLRKILGDNMPEDIRVATIYYKPLRNITGRVPEYFIHETNEWIVFPHEIEAISIEEIRANMGDNIADIVVDALSSV